MGSLLRARAPLPHPHATFKAVLAALVEQVGADHPPPLTTRANLAGVLQDLGQLEQARDEFKAVLAALIEQVGADHPDTLTTRHNLAYVLQQLGLANDQNA
ncbi:tetratricopeptide repeat-containing protein [Saccharomonospora viridis]|uniref:Tetratricopeptide repeat-containing protein n=1 Tax=Saccharomonospora viridis TaxID=1852 RepID=A0A837D468_9PSEU|nr:tetratricopeptide repeat-containing protein [Saccharomonospora viridis]